MRPTAILLLSVVVFLPSRPAATAPPVAPPSPGATGDGADDPYFWLEDVNGDKALEWVKARNLESTRRLAESEDFKKLNQRLLDIFNSQDRIPDVTKIGEQYYNFWRDAQHERGVWRRTSLEEYRKPQPAWETVLDLDLLGAAEKENWVWHGADCLPPAYRRCLIELSRGGADAQVTREFDLPAKAFVKDGFSLPEAKGGASWIDADTLYVGTELGPGSMTASGYPRIAKRWRRGTPLAQAETVYEGRPEDIGVGAYHDHTPGFERDFVRRTTTFYSNELHVMRGGKLVKIPKPDDAEASTWRDVLLLELRTDWRVGDVTYPGGALLAAGFDDFLVGKARIDVLFRPSDRTSLAGYSTTRHHLMLNELDNVKNRIYVLTPGEAGWRREPLPAMPGIPAYGTVSARAIDRYESDDYFLNVTDFLTPRSLHLVRSGQGAPEKLKQSPAFFKADGLAVSQHEAISKDGTRVPYFQVGGQELKADGTHPTLLYGYGGFESSLLPFYNAVDGAGWMEKGGVYVLANIRGGGEFGPRWHQAALKANRPRSYEDFIAVAEDLIARKITSRRHLGILGASNGGLLVGNMLTMRPDLFGAVVCQSPLLDMKRYHKLLAGASWMQEYGNPDDPREWEFIRGFSPYHNLRQGVTYPPTLFTTSTRDDRVHPGHARKMAAKMLAWDKDVLYYENVEGGHGGAANLKQAAYLSALAYTFLWQHVQ